jgi:hypothetical protein
MRFIKSLIILSAIFAASLSSSWAGDVIKDKNEFIQKVVGKKVAMSANTWLSPKRDGKLDGRVKGIKVHGNWYWQGDFWCRTARVGIIPIPRECQKITMLNNKSLELKRHKGTGTSHIYTVN